MRPLPSPRNARTRSAAAGSRDAIRGGLDRQLGGPMVAPDGHLNAALAEAGELLPYLGEALHGARRDCQLEPRPIARPQRIRVERPLPRIPPCPTFPRPAGRAAVNAVLIPSPSPRTLVEPRHGRGPANPTLGETHGTSVVRPEIERPPRGGL